MSLSAMVALIGVSLATVTDWLHRRVPNWLTVTLFVAGIMISALTAGWQGLADSLLGAALGLLLLLWPFAMGWIGAGDCKLLIAVGALLGMKANLWVALYGAIAGGLGALALVVYRMLEADEFREQIRLVMISLGLWFTQPIQNKKTSPTIILPATQAALRAKFPYAFTIAVGTALVLWQGHP